MQIERKLKTALLSISMLFGSFGVVASEEGDNHHDDVKGHGSEEVDAHHGGESNDHEEKDKPFDVVEMVMDHVTDGHDWHLFDYEGADGHEHAFSVPLPIILIDNGLKVFMSSEFEHGHATVHKGESNYILKEGKIYKADVEGVVLTETDKDGNVAELMPMDFSITKNVASMFVSVLLLLLIFRTVAKSYKKNDRAPKGLAGVIEPIVVFVREDIARPNIGEKKYEKFTPYLLTLFFFIWINNLLGLIPGGANFTGNISVTLVLAGATLLLINLNGNKNYWGHIFATPGVPVWLSPIMIPVEIIGIFAKPFALMVRLFANITAGHIVVLALVSLIFIFKTLWISPASVALVLFIFVLELLVAVLQAYIFALLTALFLGMAVDESDH